MSEDIVHRLRREIPTRGDIGLQQLAAAEIERLRVEWQSMMEHRAEIAAHNAELSGEIERLRMERTVFGVAAFETHEVLREALEEIAELGDVRADEAGVIARRALETYRVARDTKEER